MGYKKRTPRWIGLAASHPMYSLLQDNDYPGELNEDVIATRLTLLIYGVVDGR